MIKDFGKVVKKNFTKKNIIVFCVAFIFLFSGLLSVMLYDVGNNMLAEIEKSDFVYPEDSIENYKEIIETETDIKIEEIIEGRKEENKTSELDENDIPIEIIEDKVTIDDVKIPDDKDVKDLDEHDDTNHPGIDKSEIENIDADDVTPFSINGA